MMPTWSTIRRVFTDAALNYEYEFVTLPPGELEDADGSPNELLARGEFQLREAIAAVASSEALAPGEEIERSNLCGRLVSMSHHLDEPWLEQEAFRIAPHFDRHPDDLETKRDWENERELGLVSTKAVISRWRPAQRFWNSFQLYDPAGVSPVRVRSPATLKRLKDDVDKLRIAIPINRLEFGEKVKVAVCVGLHKAICRVSQNLPQQADDYTCLKSHLLNFIRTYGEAFAPLMIHGSEQSPFAAPQDPDGARQLVMMKHAIDIAGDRWISALKRDAAALQIGTPILPHFENATGVTDIPTDTSIP